ncbi:MAG: hypothetical protein Q8O92_12275 [Candidatus Latescibacter sp.]|nr:hypothetical protein [Candidatus Latescibacter sp.]
MNRRDMLRLIPLAASGLLASARPISAGESLIFGHEPLPSEPPALVYPRRIRELLTHVRLTQSKKILEAAYIIARAVEKGNTVWSYWDQGHTHRADIFPGRWGEPEIITIGYDPQKSRKGDVFLASYPFSPDYLDDIRKKEITVIGSPSPYSGDMKGAELATPRAKKLLIRPVSSIWIETEIDILGAQVKIPGSYAPLGPESGPLCGTIFWMMLADACRILARDGKSVKVKGDEPPLGKEVTYSSLDAPLMDDYFDEVMRQLEMIGMELGNIRKMAGLAVDSLLAGGSVYFYSRYPECLAAEAVGRRGGYAFAKGCSDGTPVKGTAKDCVIMGIYAPDDTADLKNLDAFRKSGMKVASIGPITRDLRIPGGRTVPRETDVHVGRMTDTFGIFALPGFERKICPLSGVLVTSLLWTMSTEIAYQIKDRTGGDVPGIYCNGAITWDAWWDEQVRAMYESRGY